MRLETGLENLVESNEHGKLEERTGRRNRDFWSLFQRGDTL